MRVPSLERGSVFARSLYRARAHNNCLSTQCAKSFRDLFNDLWAEEYQKRTVNHSSVPSPSFCKEWGKPKHSHKSDS